MQVLEQEQMLRRVLGDLIEKLHRVGAATAAAAAAAGRSLPTTSPARAPVPAPDRQFRFPALFLERSQQQDRITGQDASEVVEDFGGRHGGGVVSGQ